MNRNKGQALVEFILIMPFLVLIIMAMIDFGNIIYKKYQLENTLDTVKELYKNNDTKKLIAYTTKNDVTLNVKQDDEFVTLTLEKEIIVNTPILNNIIGKEYKIVVNTSVYGNN